MSRRRDVKAAGSTSISIEAHLRSTSKDCGLRKWVDSKNACSKDEWFKLIDGFHAIFIATFPFADWVEPACAALMKALAKEGSLYSWVDSNGKDTSDKEAWMQICEAAAMVLIDRWVQEVLEKRP